MKYTKAIYVRTRHDFYQELKDAAESSNGGRMDGKASRFWIDEEGFCIFFSPIWESCVSK